jgi:drug/metabolite transporter (DMT)-like permease
VRGRKAVVDENAQPAAVRSGTLIGVLCGIAAALGWAGGFVAAKHGVSVGFEPADLAFHRFFWSGLLLMPLAMRDGLIRLGGIGWGRGLLMSVLSGPPQALIAYTGFTLVPLGHGTTIQPATAALFGLILASVALHERATAQRIFGGAIIIVGLLVFGIESVTTIGSHGIGGDMLFVTAGFFWAAFGTLLRYYRMSGPRAVATVGVLSIVLYTPLFALFVGFHNIMQMSLTENVIQIFVQGIFAGVLPIYLYARAVMLLGAGRTATFPALVPVFGVIIGYLALGVMPTVPQLIGLVIVVIGFRFALR